jgi:hypothetical protein
MKTNCVVSGIIFMLMFGGPTMWAQTSSPCDDSIVIRPYADHFGGILQIIYCDKNLIKNKKFVRPLIIAEGYDACKVLGTPDITIANIPTAMRDELKKGYDIIYLNYEDGVDDILHNAKLLEEAIELVNANKILNPLTGQFEQTLVLFV